MSLLTLHHAAAAPEFAVRSVAGVEELGVTVEQTASADRPHKQLIDEALAQSFPASAPPSWVQVTALPPT